MFIKKNKTTKSPLLVRTLSILGHPLEHPLCQSVLVGRDAAPRLSLLLVELLVSIAAQRFPLLTFFPSGQCLCPGRPMLSATRSPETRDSSLFQFNAWEPIAVPYLSHLLKLTCVNNQHDHGPWLCPPDGERQEGRGERERLQVVNLTVPAPPGVRGLIYRKPLSLNLSLLAQERGDRSAGGLVSFHGPGPAAEPRPIHQRPCQPACVGDVFSATTFSHLETYIIA